MKKKLSLILVLLVIALPLFTGIDKGTIAGVYTIENISYPKSNTIGDQKITSAGAFIKGTSFFSPVDNLGMSYAVGVRKMNSLISGGTSLDVSKEPLYVDIGAAAVYQAPVNLDLFSEFGVGFLYSIQSETDSGATFELSTLYITASLEFNYALQSNLFFSAGVHAGYPLMTTGSIKIGGGTLSGEIETKGFYFSPYAGLSFAY
jgi:hypothetical protein